MSIYSYADKLICKFIKYTCSHDISSLPLPHPRIVYTHRIEDQITNLVQTIISKGQKLNDKELVESDLIVPDSDISIGDKVFKGKE